MAAKACSVLITGANRGLGLEMVKQMVESPWPVRQLLACCRDLDGLRSHVFRELAVDWLTFSPLCLSDATDPCSIKESARWAVWWGRLGESREPEKHTYKYIVEDIENVFVFPKVYKQKEFLPYLQAAATASGKPGMSCSKPAVVSISSTVGSIATIKEMYSFFPIASAGLNMLTLCATEEFRKDEILFAVLHPGWVRTDMGGEGVSLTESVEGLLCMMDSLTEKQTGAFLDHEGKVMPW
uniref:C-factor n=1 Tax=Salmo trutta TaxID=8032 RepID=A0A674CXV3_SALTR